MPLPSLADPRRSIAPCAPNWLGPNRVVDNPSAGASVSTKRVAVSSALAPTQSTARNTTTCAPSPVGVQAPLQAIPSAAPGVQLWV